MAKRTGPRKRQAATTQRVEPGRSSRKARQAEIQRRHRRNRTAALTGLGAVVAIVIVMVAIAALNKSSNPAARSGGAGTAAVLAQHVPVSALRSVGAGTGVTPPQALPPGTPPLEQGGKPEVLYIGAEYCPYCAAERWPVVVALARFGSFTNLGGTESSASDIFPRTQTFTFHGASYASEVLSFVGIETNTNQPSGSGGYTTLEEPTASESALLARYDRAPYTTQAGAIPFLLIGNRYVSIGASYDASLLQGMSRDQIARALSDATSPVARAVLGAANTLTAAICVADGGKPSSVCSDPTIAKIIQTLPAS
jgi:hypothetical protein